jgi:hypothetical protein
MSMIAIFAAPEFITIAIGGVAMGGVLIGGAAKAKDADAKPAPGAAKTDPANRTRRDRSKLMNPRYCGQETLSSANTNTARAQVKNARLVVAIKVLSVTDCTAKAKKTSRITIR